jgi:N-dimethylarginine dimethylaminohydrolase
MHTQHTQPQAHQPAILLCRPDFYRVEYEINPWMKKGSVDQALAKEQWQQLKETLEKTCGARVEWIAQDQAYPDMVFAADQGFVFGKTVVLSNFRFEERKGETALFRAWFEAHDFAVKTVVPDLYFEGGDCLQYSGQVLMGYGFRSQREVGDQLTNLTNMPVVPLELIDPRFYHLHTCLFVLDAETAFCYPAAFSPASLEKLRSIVPNVQILTEKQTEQFSTNNIVIGKTVVTGSPDQAFHESMRACGFEVEYLAMSEFWKSGGSVHCLSLEIEA